ncbi:hypothetical protein Leryth_001264 [Lithospermum erythrorhizon]|nr:hypothetical protein Leryth_001264 [Lithospermum erythrorhizon]
MQSCFVVNAVQRTLVEAWGLIRETFVDPTFNHQDWDEKLQQTMVEMFPLRTEDAAYNKVKGMLSTLGIRVIIPNFISPKNVPSYGFQMQEYQSFRRLKCMEICKELAYLLVLSPKQDTWLITAVLQMGPKNSWTYAIYTTPYYTEHRDYKLIFEIYQPIFLLEIGLKFLTEFCAIEVSLFLRNTSGNLFQVVSSCVDNGPAARAGIHEGDELVEINGHFIILSLNDNLSSG